MNKSNKFSPEVRERAVRMVQVPVHVVMRGFRCAAPGGQDAAVAGRLAVRWVLSHRCAFIHKLSMNIAGFRVKKTTRALVIAALGAGFGGRAGAVAVQPPVDELAYRAPPAVGPIELVVRREGPRVQIYNGGILVAQRPMLGIDRIRIGGPDRTDTRLTIDYRGGPIPAAMEFMAGALGPRTDNELVLRGGAFAATTSVAYGPHDGVIQNGAYPIRYSNLTPIVDSAFAVNYTFNDFGATPHTTNIINSAGAMQINDGGSGNFETTTISNKTNVTYVIAQSATNIVFNDPAPPAGMAQVTLTDNVGNSTFSVTPTTIPVIANGHASTPPTDTLTVNVPGGTTYSLSATHSAAGYAGTYTFNHGYGSITFSNMLSITPAPAPAVPTLTNRALAVLAGLLALTGFGQVRRRRR